MIESLERRQLLGRSFRERPLERFVTGEIGKMPCHIGVTRCLGSLSHVLVHLRAFNKFCRHRIHEVFMIALQETVELRMLLEVLLVFILGGMLQDSAERLVSVLASLLGEHLIFGVENASLFMAASKSWRVEVARVSPQSAAFEMEDAIARTGTIRILRKVSSLDVMGTFIPPIVSETSKRCQPERLRDIEFRGP